MKKIVLVGNGRSLLSRRGLGEAIDNFDIVVRFNDFQSAGFETCVGSRTDWWARNELPMGPRPERFSRILLRPRMEEPDEYGRTAELTTAELRAQHGETPVELVGRDVFVQLKENYGFRNAPFTGTLVVAHLLKSFQQVHLCGFDGLNAPAEALRHYYSEGNIVADWSEYHDSHLDSRYLGEMMASNRVVAI